MLIKEKNKQMEKKLTWSANVFCCLRICILKESKRLINNNVAELFGHGNNYWLNCNGNIEIG